MYNKCCYHDVYVQTKNTKLQTYTYYKMLSVNAVFGVFEGPGMYDPFTRINDYSPNWNRSED